MGPDATHVVNHTSSFSDLFVRHWAFNFIKKIYSEKFMVGDESGTFRPDNSATRAEIATILVRLRGLEPENSEEQLFTDVNRNDWYSAYVYTVVKAGLIQGYPYHTFKLNKPVTRVEFVTMFNRALYREDVPQISNVSSFENIHIFPDVSKDFWAYKYILEAAIPHIIIHANRHQLIFLYHLKLFLFILLLQSRRLFTLNWVLQLLL